MSVAVAQSLRSRAAEKLYLPEMEIPPPSKPALSRKGSEDRLESATEPPPAANASPINAPVIVRRPLVIPAVARPPRDQQIVLQPPDELTNTSTQRTPPILSWVSRLPDVPRIKPRLFVTPGRRAVPQPPPELAAPPKLDAPNQEYAHSTLNIATAPPKPQPALPAPPAATAPVRAFKPPAETDRPHDGSYTLIEGDPVALVVLSSAPPPLDRLVPIPPGISMAPASLEANKRDGHAGTGEGANGRGAPNRSSSGSGVRPGDSQRGGGNGASTASRSGTSTRKGEATTALSLDIGTGSNTLANNRAPASAKVSAFDVVVVQSSNADPLVQSAGLLKGKPVYSVYLNVGTAKAWILQYCLSVEGQGPPANGAVQRGDLSVIAPPYPLTTGISELELGTRPHYTLIHGFLSATGKFRDLTLVGRANPQMTRLLHAIENWEFRPATKDQHPVEVEALLTVPAGL